MKKACIFLAEGFEEVEALTIVDLIRRAQIEITMVSIGEDIVVNGAHQIIVHADQKFFEHDYSDMDMLILPGGMPGTLNLEKHEGLRTLLVGFNKENKFIAAICAAPRVLGLNEILKGKKATAYPGNEDKLLGAEFILDKVVVSDNIITSRGLGTAIDFSLKLIEILTSQAEADKIRKAIIY